MKFGLIMAIVPWLFVPVLAFGRSSDGKTLSIALCVVVSLAGMLVYGFGRMMASAKDK